MKNLSLRHLKKSFNIYYYYHWCGLIPGPCHYLTQKKKKKTTYKKINCPRPQTKQMNEMKNKEQKENKPTEETKTRTSLTHIRKVKEN